MPCQYLLLLPNINTRKYNLCFFLSPSVNLSFSEIFLLNHPKNPQNPEMNFRHYSQEFLFQGSVISNFFKTGIFPGLNHPVEKQFTLMAVESSVLWSVGHFFMLCSLPPVCGGGLLHLIHLSVVTKQKTKEKCSFINHQQNVGCESISFEVAYH